MSFLAVFEFHPELQINLLHHSIYRKLANNYVQCLKYHYDNYRFQTMFKMRICSFILTIIKIGYKL